MTSTAFVYGFFYIGAAIFLIGVVARAIGYANAPIHLRWELYPVPHEEPSRAEHGGSYFETTDWWAHKSRFNWWGELRAMLMEMVFLKGLREFNRKLWRRSFPFHFGLYLIIAGAATLMLSVLLGVFQPPLLSGAFATALEWVYTTLGWAGSVLVILGALGLLYRRLTDEDLKNYTTPGDFFNLSFFVVTVGVFCADALFRKPGAAGLADFVRGLLTFDTNLALPPVLSAAVILAAVLVAYIPYTHMSHFVGKYFTYHSVRWNDDPLIRGGKLEKKMAAYLTYRPTWSAPHIRADGQKTWAELASVNPAQEKAK